MYYNSHNASIIADLTEAYHKIDIQAKQAKQALFYEVINLFPFEKAEKDIHCLQLFAH